MPASSHINSTERCFKYVNSDEWVTSGKIGSREAVLVFRTNILNPKTRKLILEAAPQQSKTGADSPSAVSTPNETIHKTSSSPTVSKTQSNYTNQGKIFVAVEKTVANCKELVNHRNPIKKSLDAFSSSDASVSSDGDETIQYNETKSRKPHKSKNTSIIEIEVNLNKESGYESATTSQSNTEINTSEEDHEASSEEDNECGINMPAHQLKITYKFIQTETKLLRKIFNVHGLTEVQGDSNFNLLWTGVHMKLDTLRNLALYQRVNHFPRSYELTRKDRLYKNIERMQHLRGMKHFDIVPQSFILPLEIRDLIFAHNKHRGPWIVKPAASSRGRGIFIVNSPDQIPQDEQVLVSKYIVDPLCIDGHKCDLRVYVLVTSFDPLIIYLYEEGIVRLATVRYDRNADNLWNPCMHLCNYSINKYHSDYIRSSDAQDEDVGHKWTLSALLRHLKLQGCDTHLLMLNIEDLIIKAVLACAQTIISACRMFVPNVNNCFELYGFDILIDNTLKPWLLEVNLSPSMGVDSPLDTKVKACLVTDLLTCVGIPAFTPEMRTHYDGKSSRLRSSSCQRQVDTSESALRSTKSKKKPVIPLTQEEQRILRSARLQYTRRGGFVRIFPTDDTMQRYGNFLDPANGIPISTPNVQGQTFQTLVTQHNYNQMLHSNLFGSGQRSAKDDNSQENRIMQYERALETDSEIPFLKKQIVEKCEEEGRRLRKQMLKKITSGSTLTHFQARQTFSLYLESVLRRLTQDPKDSHEKIIIKFLTKYGGGVKPPVLFKNSQNISKARSAMVAKLLGDFLELYRRDTEAYIDSFDHFGMIPTNAYSLFLMHAQESDLEAVLTHHTNVTGIMPFLYNRCGLSVPATPPIPSGLHGFLRALPAMVTSYGMSREVSKYDGYIKNCDKNCENVQDISLRSRSTRDSK
ncbi:tubulin polyglutamylase ttll-5 isoform X1 [Drosophila sulfurigaster albostrigata]|uniref:tubulin polyglutamylase ttll-5 isoform X1 n=1 Tax=Drosophila sulfurigaster albostrigata TaxID=89887 RepID=UPI002D21B54E|nr:tubulin polyglutamylase ttll-5 isoform X1 [Drosophila sulfurigaster albostrigata]XP_062123781.1 tubulin polyglutamylase ttll-5 isoform X1 [Drosophila sulfurigaster albostrigata]